MTRKLAQGDTPAKSAKINGWLSGMSNIGKSVINASENDTRMIQSGSGRQKGEHEPMRITNATVGLIAR